MKYLWILVILSASAFGQNAYGPDYLNLHCTAPDPLAQVLFNIPPRPGLVPDHAANGNAILYCDAGSGLMKASYNGSAYNFLGAPATALDVRTSASVFDCTGNTAMDTAMQSISATAHVIVPFGCIVKLASAHTYPQTFEFKQGGQLAPTTGTLITLTGPIIAGSTQIFSNALATQGGISFQGNPNTFDVLPEWWGAGTLASAATNTTAIQAAIYGAFGCNVSPVTSCRTNGSGLNQYNKTLYIGGFYNISGELHWYHVISFLVKGSGRLTSGITQNATNARVIDSQSMAYGSFRDMNLASLASQDLNHPLVDINFDGSQGADLKPQFLDFYNMNFSGGGTTKIGVRIAAAGGGAQGSNINFFNPAAISFTEAAYMIGSGSGCVQSTNAANAIQISWYGGDMQGNHAYGVEDFGGGNLLWDGGSAENGSNAALGGVQQTGADFCANNINAGNGGFTIKHMRSESSYLLAPIGGGGNSGGWNLIDVLSVDNISFHAQGGNAILNDLVEGEASCGHGLWWKVTTAGNYSGLGSRISPLTASGGSATTIVDGTGGFTVNAWVGFYVCTLSPLSTLPPEYCLITSNTANTFTCSGGWQTDYPIMGTGNPTSGVVYDIQPAWTGTTVTSGTATVTRDDTTYSGIQLSINSVFPGKKVSFTPSAIVDGNGMTRADWSQFNGQFSDVPLAPGETSVIVGSPQVTASGVAGGISLNPYFVRTWTLSRNGVVEVPLLTRKDYGTRVLHWFAGQTTQGASVTDAYLGIDPLVPTLSSPAGSGDLFILNNSNNVQKKWTFNFDGSANAPGPWISGGLSSGACANPTNGYAFPGGSNNNVNITTFGSNAMDFCANGTRALTLFSTLFQVNGTVNFGFEGGKGQHFFTQAAGNDMAGTCTAAAAATCTVTFTTAYTSAPACTVTDQTNITTVKALPSTTTLVITTAAATSDVFSYICIGNPN